MAYDMNSFKPNGGTNPEQPYSYNEQMRLINQAKRKIRSLRKQVEIQQALIQEKLKEV